MPEARGRRGWVTLACCLAAGCTRGGTTEPAAGPRGTPTRLTASAAGSPLGAAQSAIVGPGGGTVISADGALTVTVPPASIPADVPRTIQQITSTAPGAVGSAYRLGPEGTTFQQAVTLTFKPGGAVALADLTVATQNVESFWLRYRDVTRDDASGTLSVTTTHFSDWGVVAANTSSDLRGVFTLTSTLDGVPYTASGDATLNYGGDDSTGSHYLQWGTLTLESPVTVGALTCTPAAPVWTLHANIADLELTPPSFDWGVSGFWTLSCTDGSTPSPSVITASFDTFGIDHLACTRGWSGTPLITLTQVAGSFVIDCGAHGTMRADLDFAAGAAP